MNNYHPPGLRGGQETINWPKINPYIITVTMENIAELSTHFVHTECWSK